MSSCCHECHMIIMDDNYQIFKNRIYCKSDFNRLFLLPKCSACMKPIENQVVSALDGKLEGQWHIQCFNCQICHASFPDEKFYVFNNQPYCKRHYHMLNNSLCYRCHEGIEDLCAHTEEGWRFHPDCFICEICQEKLNDIYYVFERRIYCKRHIQPYPSRSITLKRRTQM
ncbi:uncharacterized protein BX663DRAFT_502829, partial [Cokeromyces recurvatus]|uniref:uncharacterized protein n=1 Tax=Cokeromyces recurvatus TaxID=90255 RepID=UPI00221ED6C0